MSEELENFVCLRQRVQRVHGSLALLIPLAGVGGVFLECTRGIAAVQGEFLKVIIPDWLATKLRIKEGSHVMVDNREGKFHIQLG